MDRRVQGRVVTSVGVLAMSLAMAPQAEADTTIGQTFVPTFVGCAVGGALSVEQFQTARVDGRSYVVPTAGVITSWSVRTGSTVGAMMTMRVFRPSGTLFRVVADASELQSLPADNALHTFATRIPVQASDIIGYRSAPLPGGSAGSCGSLGPTADQSRLLQSPSPTPIDTIRSYGNATGAQIDISAGLEPDADGDGFGDETQDRCPSDPGTAGPCPIIRRPDALIRTSSATYLGNGIYNTVGTGQTVTVQTRRARKATFFIDVQNDGTSTDSFTLAGAGTKRGFAVTIFAGTENITSAVVHGTFRLENLDAGQHRVIKLVVKVKATAKKGTRMSWPVVATSTDNATSKDTVIANVKVPKG